MTDMSTYMAIWLYKIGIYNYFHDKTSANAYFEENL